MHTTSTSTAIKDFVLGILWYIYCTCTHACVCVCMCSRARVVYLVFAIYTVHVEMQNTLLRGPNYFGLFERACLIIN